MSGKLFQPAPRDRGMDNAVVGGVWASRYVYVNGYYRAARQLAELAATSEPQDLLFYPICFNYRHYLELHLKGLIFSAELLYLDLVKMGWEVQTLESQKRDDLADARYHNLHRLLNLVEERLCCVSDEPLDSAVRKIILEFHQTDVGGQVYRYHRTTQDEPSLPDVEHFDIANIAEKMEEVHWHLMGVDLWISHHHDTTKSVISDLSPY